MQPPKGTRDFLSEEYKVFKHVTDTLTQTAERYGYKGIALPMFEHTEVFARSLGESSDIVHKEMYTFLDKKGRSLTLRPEFTASIARHIISNSLAHSLPLRLFTQGSLFRYERPQKGRYREFHQVDVEFIGKRDPAVDVEVICLAQDMINQLGISDVVLEINTLGDEETRRVYRERLVSYFKSCDFSEDSKMRLEKNPLRILDSKDAQDQAAVANAPSILDFLNTRSREFFENVYKLLDGMGVKYTVKPSLVRGLDYYTDTIFEFVTTKLGSQGTVLAGGRYDNLIQQMGGPSVPAIGFAVGIERLMELFDGSINADRAVYVIGLDESCGLASMQLASKLRASGRYVHTECTNNLSKALKIAAQENARFVVLIGEDEIKSGQFRLKDMDARSETLLSEEQLIQEINRNER